ncbi:MAG: hypothetical protein ACLPUT_11765 [Solirubrobacteraceae bacterium]
MGAHALKRRAIRAEAIPMPQGRSRLCAPLALAVLAATALCGCAGAESGSPTAEAHGGVLGALVRQVDSQEGESGEAESSDAELKELVDRETSPEERQELREGLEEAQQSEGGQEQVEQAQEQAEQAQEQPAAEQQETEFEREQEQASEREREQEER